MRSPLAARIFDGRRWHDVTRACSDLSFTKSAYGGHETASCNLSAALSQFPDLGPADRFVVEDARGRVVWDGFTNNPGEQSSSAGTGLAISAVGSKVLAADRAERLIYRDTDLGNWESDPVDASLSASSQQADVFPKDAGTRAGMPALVLQFPKGTTVPPGAVAAMRYTKFRESSMAIGAMQFFLDGGTSAGVYEHRVRLLDAGAGYGTASSIEAVNGDAILNTTGAFVDFTSSFHELNRDIQFSLQSTLGQAATVPNDDTWAAIGGANGVGVLGQPVTRYGNLSFNPRSGWWFAHEIVEDLLGRMLSACDPDSAVIEQGSFNIDTIAFMEPTTANGVFELLTQLEDFHWGIGETMPSGKRRFWWKSWPDAPRYVLDDRDAIDLPGSDDTLCNRVAVEWVSARGYQHITVMGAEVPELGVGSPILNGQIDPAFSGRIVDAERVTLPQGHGSYTNAVRAGTRALAATNARRYAGTAVVDRPILDRQTGRTVMPWELEPGSVARLQAKGVNVRVTGVDFSDNDASASLTLNTPILSTEARLERLARRR